MNIWTFTVTFDLELKNPIFTQDAPKHDDVPSNEIWPQKEQTIPNEMVETIFDHSPHCDRDLEDS